jgi:outer membrane protein assembly factor BamD (BamD/ComL family)
MTMSIKHIFLFALPLALIACGGEDKPVADEPRMIEARTRIRAKEDSLFENRAFDRRTAQGMVDVYKAYAAAYPVDSMAPEYLFRAAGTLKSMGDAEQAIKLYDRISEQYPGWRRRVDVLYMKALTLDDDLDRDGEAKTIYQQVMYEYPEHPFARDAKAMIENLGLSDEELIEKFKRMNEAQEAATPAQ